MSVRAYKVKKIERAEEPTFNLWHESALCDFLNFDNQLSNEGSGMVWLEVGLIRGALEQYKKGDLKIEDPTVVAMFKKDIEGLADDESVEYMCY